MNLTEAIRVALQSLWANKLRSILTLLGVVIGVGAVIAVLTFVSGINRYIAEKVFNLGADVFIINKHSSVITNIDQLIEGEKRKDLTLEDYYAVADGCRGFDGFPRFESPLYLQLAWQSRLGNTSKSRIASELRPALLVRR